MFYLINDRKPQAALVIMCYQGSRLSCVGLCVTAAPPGRPERPPSSGAGSEPATEDDQQQQLAAALAALHLEPAEQWQPALHNICRLAATGSDQLWRDHYRYRVAGLLTPERGRH